MRDLNLTLKWKRRKGLILRWMRNKASTLTDKVSILKGQASVQKGRGFILTDQVLIQKDQASTQIGMKGRAFTPKENGLEEGLLEVATRMIENTLAVALRTMKERAVAEEAGAGEAVQTVTDQENLKEGAGGLEAGKENLADRFWISLIIVSVVCPKTTSLQVVKQSPESLLLTPAKKNLNLLRKNPLRTRHRKSHHRPRKQRRTLGLNPKMHVHTLPPQTFC